MRHDIERRVIVVADPYPPYQYVEGGVVKGADHDLVSGAFKRLGFGVETVLLSWEQCLERLDRRKAHAAFQATRTPERERHYLFSRLLRAAETALFCRTDLSLRLDPGMSIGKQLEGMKLGMVKGYSYHSQIDMLPSFKAESQDELLIGAEEGRFDVVVMDTGVAGYLMRKLRLSGLRRLEGFVVTRDLHVVFRKDCGELLKQFDQQLERMIAEGLPEEIAREYGLA